MINDKEAKEEVEEARDRGGSNFISQAKKLK